MNPVLDAARRNRAATQERLDALLVVPTEEARSLNAEETSTFDQLIAERDNLDHQIEALSAEDERRAAAQAVAAEVGTETLAAGESVIRREQMTYDKGREDNHYFRDLAAMQIPGLGWDVYGAAERMRQHGKEVEIEARRDQVLADKLHEIRMTPQSLKMEQRSTVNTTAGTGGGRQFAALAA